MQGLLTHRQRELARGGVEAAEELVSPEKRARLAALGYLGSSGPADLGRFEIASDLPDPHRVIAVFRELSEGKQLIDRQPAMAAAILEHAKLTDPSNPFLLMYLALSYQKLGETELLRREVDHLLEVAPEHLGGHLLLAELLASEGDDAGAIRALERTLELDPKNQATRLLFAHRLEDSGRDGEASAAYEALLELAPEHTLGRNGYATLLYRHGRVEDAVAELESILRAQPFYAPAYLNLAVIRHDQGRIDDSERLVGRALELRPVYGLAHELHALNLELLGDPDGARTAWEMARRFAVSVAARERAEDAVAGQPNKKPTQ